MKNQSLYNYINTGIWRDVNHVINKGVSVAEWDYIRENTCRKIPCDSLTLHMTIQDQLKKYDFEVK